MNEQKIHGILTDALKAANATFDTDGSTIWVEADGGRTFAVCVSGCAHDDDGADDRRTYSVSLHATFAGTFDVKASSESEAEEIVRDRFAAEDIKVCDLALDNAEANATEVD